MNPKVLLLGLGAILVYLVTRKQTGLLSPTGVAQASTASPYGSASGILTPTGGSPTASGGFLSGLEAFLHPATPLYSPNQSVFQQQETLSAAAILSSESAAPVQQNTADIAAAAATPPPLNLGTGEQPVDLSFLGSGGPDLQVPTSAADFGSSGDCVDC